MIIFDTDNGRDLKAAAGFIKALSDAANADGGCEVVITVGNIQLKAYDHAALIQGLLDAVKYFKTELEGWC
jgi:hypothetical protein